MAAEQVLRLLDSFWFETTILTKKHPSKLNPKVDQISETKVEEVLPFDTKFLLVPTLEVRSKSDQTLDSTSFVFSYSLSPNSVLTPTKLRTIPSGREIREFSKGTSENHEKEDIKTEKKQGHVHGRRRPKKGKIRRSSSLTELEFKELKGFMDLGFVFSEEDKDSKLVSLIPGLQRLGREDDADKEQQNIDETVISDMPYLSEAWDVLDQMEKGNPLQNWRVPIRGSEIDMKHNLRFWAHTVATCIRC